MANFPYPQSKILGEERAEAFLHVPTARLEIEDAHLWRLVCIGPEIVETGVLGRRVTITREVGVFDDTISMFYPKAEIPRMIARDVAVGIVHIVFEGGRKEKLTYGIQGEVERWLFDELNLSDHQQQRQKAYRESMLRHQPTKLLHA